VVGKQSANRHVCREKSFEFAVRIVRLARYIQGEHKAYVLSNQVLRSETSIGANIEESAAAASRRDFTAKMAIASTEARETMTGSGFCTKPAISMPRRSHLSAVTVKN